jgi:hypothetical protein
MSVMRPSIGSTILLAIAVSACHGESPTAPASIVNFQGQYSGRYTVTACTETVAGACTGSGFTNGAIFPITLSLTQTQSNVTGSMTLGGARGPFTGVVQPAGNLTGTASMDPFANAGLTIVMNVTDWNTTLTGSSLNGTFTLTIVYSGTTNAVQTVKATIAQLVRS